MAEQDIRRTRTCERCKTTMSLDQVRYYPKSHDVYMIVCDKCRDELKKISRGDLGNLRTKSDPMLMKPKIPKILESIPSPTPKPAEKTPVSSTDDFSKVTYNCSRCDYDFKVDEYSLRTPKAQCPYCGKSDKTKRK